MTPCPTCGEPFRNPASRGAMLAKENPPELFWHGRKVKMAALKVRLIALLLRFGQVSNGALEMLLGEDTGAKALSVHFTQIRELFRREGIPVSIENIRGWGYQIEGTG